MTNPHEIIGRLVLCIGGEHEGCRGVIAEIKPSAGEAVGVRVRREFHSPVLTVLLSDIKFID